MHNFTIKFSFQSSVISQSIFRYRGDQGEKINFCNSASSENGSLGQQNDVYIVRTKLALQKNFGQKLTGVHFAPPCIISNNYKREQARINFNGTAPMRNKFQNSGVRTFFEIWDISCEN